MNRFAVQMAIFMVFLVGGGIVAYNQGVRDGSAHMEGKHEGDKGLPSPEEANAASEAGTTPQLDGNATDPGQESETEGNAQADQPQDQVADNPTNDQSKPDTGPADSMGTQEDNAEGGTEMAASGNVENGKTVFNNCAGCHGANGEGGFGPKLAGVVSKWTADGLKVTLREGKTPDGKTLQPGMPRFAEGQISDEQVVDLHAFLSTLQ